MSEYNRVTKPDYFEDLANDDVANEQNWDDLEKHGYHNYTFSANLQMWKLENAKMMTKTNNFML